MVLGAQTITFTGLSFTGPSIGSSTLTMGDSRRHRKVLKVVGFEPATAERKP